MHRVHFAAVFLVAASPLVAGGPLADGEFDPAFQDGGKFVFDVNSEGGKALAVTSTGTLLVGYTANLSGTDKDMRFVAVPDQGVTAFCGSYAADLGGTDADVLSDLAVHDGIVYVAGTAAGPSEDPDPVVAVASFTLDGCDQTSFGGEDGVIVSSTSPLELRRIVLTPEGLVRVAAQRGADTSRELRSFGISAGGVVDGTYLVQSVDFATAFGADFFEPNDMVRQPDGKIVVVGTVETAGDRDVGVVRFLPNGVLDGSFSVDGLASFSYDIVDAGDDEGDAVALLPDGRIVVGGRAPGFMSIDAAVAVLTPTGGFFNDFGLIGRYTFSFIGTISESSGIDALVTQGDGKIVGVGVTSIPLSADWAVVRLFSEGDAPLDASFHEDGKRWFGFNLPDGDGIDRAYDVTLEQGGKITIAGIADSESSFAVAAVRLWNSYVFADGFEWGQLIGTGWNLPGPVE